LKYYLKYKRYNEYSILIEWPAVIDEDILTNIINFKNNIENSYIESLVEVNSAYNSILVIYDCPIEDVNGKINELKRIYTYLSDANLSSTYLWEIPVCYNEEFAIDLDHLSERLKLSKSEIITRHSQQIYTIYFLGFLPGFLYLGGLDKLLQCDRKSTPELNIKKGAVGIGGNQTGVYPQNSPGGWHIIGNSPIQFFDAKRYNPCFAKAGDKIKFVPIEKQKYNEIINAIALKTYSLKRKLLK